MRRDGQLFCCSGYPGILHSVVVVILVVVSWILLWSLLEVVDFVLGTEVVDFVVETVTLSVKGSISVVVVVAGTAVVLDVI